MSDLLVNQDGCAITSVEITRSSRRRKSVGARLKGNVMLVSAPCHIPDTSLESIIKSLKEKFSKSLLRKKLNQEKCLVDVAEGINRKYFYGKLKDYFIEYVTGQKSKFGCCNYQSRSIRISHRIAFMPQWVRDYVIMHELAHLIEPNHSKAFWDLVANYKLAERARGYLIAKGMEEEDADNE